MKKILLVLFIGVLIIGLGVGVYLVQNPQIFKPKASCGEAGCKAVISFNPSTYTIANANETTDVKIALDTQGVEINGINIIINYPASDFTDIQPTGFALDSGISNWQIALNKTSTPGKAEFSARYNVTQQSPGYKTTGSVNFATLTIKGISNSQKTLSFDSASSATEGVNSTDVLLTPAGNATVTVGSGSVPVYYSCQTGGCQADTSGAHTFANDPTCNNTCTGATTHTYYKCLNNACVVDSVGTGFADDNTCNNSCGTAVVKPSPTNLGNNTTLQSSPTVISGTAKPGTTITITFHSVQTLTGTALTNSAGVWTWNLTDTLTDGTHTLTVTDDQNPAQSSTIAFTITTPANGASTTQHYRCSGSSCVPDQSGQYTSSNCNSTCTSSTTTTTTSTTTTTTAHTSTSSGTLPNTASSQDTFAMAAVGLVALLSGAFLFLLP